MPDTSITIACRPAAQPAGTQPHPRPPRRDAVSLEDPAARDAWWRDGLLYQVYPRSFADSNGDGHGDLRGITNHLDHLERLGVTGLWLNPIHPSPNRDWGYDVTDYRAIEPSLGTLDDLDELIAAASARGIGLLLDLVPNHTSDQHPWFLEACSSRESPYRDHYVWADAAPDGGPPNNWVSMFGGAGWTWHEPTRQYYLHNFTTAQPDLNWWSESVRAEFDDILRFWLERGVSGFRVDVCHGIVKDRHLRDNPPAEPGDRDAIRARGQRVVYNMNRPEVLDVLRRWRTICDEQGAVLLGETGTYDLERLATFYGDTRGADGTRGDCLDLAFNFPFMHAAFTADALAAVISRTEATLPAHGQPVWTLSNHDSSRCATRWCGGDERKLRLALMLLFCLRGTPLLYYGDELGLADVPVPIADVRDPLGHGRLPGKEGRDPCRTPMRWSSGLRGGFCDESVESWLPCADAGLAGVREQMRDSNSVLALTRALSHLRAANSELRSAPVELHVDGGVLELDRGPLRIVLNMSDEGQAIPAGHIVLTSAHAAVVDGTLSPWCGAIVACPR